MGDPEQITSSKTHFKQTTQKSDHIKDGRIFLLCNRVLQLFSFNNIFLNYSNSDTTWQYKYVIIMLKPSTCILVQLKNRGENMAKILIIEDEKAIKDLVKFNLELVGHECFQVFDGETGLSEILKLKYDLIILDVMLPKH